MFFTSFQFHKGWKKAILSFNVFLNNLIIGFTVALYVLIKRFYNESLPENLRELRQAFFEQKHLHTYVAFNKLGKEDFDIKTLAAGLLLANVIVILKNAR